MTPAALDAFLHTWTAQVLTTPPLIAPARQFTYPLRVPGEEDALARGALLLNIKPAQGPHFLATCALGFTDPKLRSGVFSCPNPNDILLVAGGYAYLVDTLHPDRCLHLPLKPVTQLFATPNLLILAGFHHLLGIGPNGIAWQSERLSWEGLTITEITGDTLHGAGWHMQSDRDLSFALDLRTGKHMGGGFLP